jgi:hypothetical protein
MGRPIQKKYFGNTNVGLDGEGVGGEQVATVVMSTTSFAVSTLTIAVSFSAPQIAGGQTATGTAVKTGNTVTSVIINNAGSGYTGAPSVSFTGTNMTSWLNAATATLSATTRADGIAIYAYIPASGTAGLVSGSGGTQRLLGDIVRQVGSSKYMVRTSEGLGRVKLVTDGVANAAGEADLTATDSSGKTYYVMKLNGRKAKLKRYGTAGHEFADQSWVKWNFDGAVEDVSVSIANA